MCTSTFSRWEMMCVPPPQSASSVKKVALICVLLLHSLSSLWDLVKGKKRVIRRLPARGKVMQAEEAKNTRKPMQKYETEMTSI
jgi:hypothetical protein